MSHPADNAFIEVVPWGEDGAIAVGFLQQPYRLLGEDEIVHDCGPSAPVVLGRAEQVPRLFERECETEPVALASSLERDLFLAEVPPFRGHEKGSSRRPPLEVRRWHAGSADPERDDLSLALDFSPRHIDSWFSPTLLVVSRS